MGKTCNVCYGKPLIGASVAGIKYYICDFFDRNHISFMKENNLIKVFKSKLRQKLAGGILFAILIQPILIFYIWGYGSGLTSKSILPQIYAVLIAVAIFIIAKFGRILYKINEGLSLYGNGQSSSPSPPENIDNRFKFCTSCGYRCKITDIFCGYCGSNIEDV